jgi:hypothetical protein
MPLLHRSVTEPADTSAFPVKGANFAALCAVSDLSHSNAMNSVRCRYPTVKNPPVQRLALTTQQEQLRGMCDKMALGESQHLCRRNLLSVPAGGSKAPDGQPIIT